MASTGLAKFNKYFRGKGEVETFAKGEKGKDVTVYESVNGTKKVDTLKDGTPITVVVGKEFQKRYFIKYKGGMGYISDNNTGKPIPSKSKVNAELSRITAGDFIGGGKSVKFKFIDQEVDCMEFTSKDQLANSIIDSMKKVRGVSDEVRETFEPWLKGNLGDFHWVTGVAPEEKNKLGVYFGELFIGLFALANKTANHATPTPWRGKVKRFLMPTDPSFSGVDSFIELEDGEIVPISSKFGTGAAASFFSNLLIKGLQYHKKLPACIFKDIVETALDIGVTIQHLEKKQKAKPILYEYGIRHVLGLNKQQVRDTYEVFTAIKMRKNFDEKNLVISAIANRRGVDKRIVDLLEDSVTAFFCREIADMLEGDKVSMETMKEILAGKNYWQANLQMNDWENGKVKFKLVNSGSAKLQIIGSKAAMNDVEAKQGMINYRLTVA